MELSVVVATLNARDRLRTCLDALATNASDAEVIVVNGPSTDGTTGMVRERDDVDVLVEIADRNVNVARNAGIREATGDAVAFVSDGAVVEPGWYDTVLTSLADGADIVVGPVRTDTDSVRTTDGSERTAVDSLEVGRYAGDNVTFSQDALTRIDGFDEYLAVDGSYDAVHRTSKMDLSATWNPEASVRHELGTVRADGFGDPDWGVTYRSLSYRLAKNAGPRPVVAGGTLRQALEDGKNAFRDVLDGSFPASRWLGNGWIVASNSCRGFADGLLARYRSDEGLNPNGARSQDDRAVRIYDWR